VVGLIAQLLEVADERLQPLRVAALGGQHPTRAGVECAGVFAWGVAGTLPRPKRWSALLSARHSVPAPPAGSPAVASAAATAALLKAV
jgi:hypothetical protein